MLRHTIILSAFFVLLASGNAGAQTATSAQLALNAGSATDITGLTSRAASASPALSVSLSRNMSLAIAASGTHFDNNAWSVTGGSSALTRHSLGPLALTMDARASFTETSYERSFLAADFTPAVEARWSGFTAFIGAHASHATNWMATMLPQSQQLPGPLGGGAPFAEDGHRQSQSRSGSAAVYGANMRVPLSKGQTFGIGVKEERGHVADAEQVDRTVSATFTAGAVAILGSAGTRDADAQRTSVASAALSFAATPTTSLSVAAGKYAANRLSGAPDGRFINAGLTFQLGHSEPALPRASGAPPLRHGMTRLSIRARDAARVELAGDFTKWSPIVTDRASNGVWYVDLKIPPGRYRYAFRINGKEWRTPEGAVTADDGFGGKSALLTIDRSTNRPQ